MLDGLLGRGHRAISPRCKSAIKRIRYRIELIQRKKKSVIRYLKKDIAELLDGGFDTNAYDRAEGVINDMKISSCYDLVEQLCGCILEQLPCMEKQRDCPPESKEAVSTLMYAAARFADLPELCDLRHLFEARYGDVLESSVNEEFIKKMASKRPSAHQKLQLLQDISEEFSISWDSKALNEKIFNASAFAYDKPKKADSPLHGKETDSEDMSPITTNAENHQPFDYQSPNDVNPNKTSNVIPPPYVKPRVREYTTKSETRNENPNNKCPPDPMIDNDCNISESVQEGFDQTGHGRQDESNRSCADEKVHHQDDTVRDAKPRPKSVRRRNPKPVVQENSTTTEGDRHMRTGQNGQVEEGGFMDKFPVECHEIPLNHENGHLDSESGFCKASSVSSQLKLSSPAEVLRESLYATSVQHGTLSSNNKGYLHTKLPNYDDLTVQFAALKG